MKLLSEKIKVIVCAVDVQEVYLSAWVFGFTGDGEIHAIMQRDFLGHTEHVESMSYRAFLDWLRSKPTFKRSDNLELPIDQVIMDMGFRTKVLYQFYPRIPIRTKILSKRHRRGGCPRSQKSGAQSSNRRNSNNPYWGNPSEAGFGFPCGAGQAQD